MLETSKNMQILVSPFEVAVVVEVHEVYSYYACQLIITAA
jgi:hypothetical protein